MDFGQLEAFVQVAAHKSFSRAAEVLQLTQPSITARIQSLERDLGEDLFERGGRGVRLTDAGHAFLPYTEKILQTLREGRDSVDEVYSLHIGSLRLGSALTISTYVLPKILHAFRERFPGINVAVRTGRSEQVLAMLLNDEVQLGLVRSLSHPEADTIRLYEDEIVLVVNPGHRFAQMAEVSIQEVAAEPVIFYDRNSSYYGLIHGLFRQAGVAPNVAMELDSLEATKRMVEEGLGIAMIPCVTIERELALGILKGVAIRDTPPLARPIALIYRRNRKWSRTVHAFINTLGEIYQIQLPQPVG